jgi:hypothetical protein
MTKVVLAAAHLDHNPAHCGRRHRNVKALSQRCYLLHDPPEHRRRTRLTLHRQRRWVTCSLGLTSLMMLRSTTDFKGAPQLAQRDPGLLRHAARRSSIPTRPACGDRGRCWAWFACDGRRHATFAMLGSCNARGAAATMHARQAMVTCSTSMIQEAT